MANIQNHAEMQSDLARELNLINDILREHGFEYPLGSRGVADMAAGYKVRQAELHRLDSEHWSAV